MRAKLKFQILEFEKKLNTNLLKFSFVFCNNSRSLKKILFEKKFLNIKL